MTALGDYGLAFIGIYIAILMAVFLHELGHALPVIMTGGQAQIEIGKAAGRTIQLGPIQLTVGKNAVWSFYGRCQWNNVPSLTVKALAHAGGPAVTIFVIALVMIAIRFVQHDVLQVVLQWVFYHQAVMALITIAPVEYPSWWGRYGEKTSDGYKFLKTLRE